MANRPVYVPQKSATSFVQEIPVEFQWFAGMSVSQKQKSIASLHSAIQEQRGLKRVLEISSKSANPIGVRLSAFNLMVPIGEQQVSVESAFQASKQFQNGGPYLDLLSMSSRDAKTDPRLRDSGPLTGFFLNGEAWPLQPTTSFYDWIYLQALSSNPDLAEALMEFEAFTDIEFNPDKSLNCQARSAALYVSLNKEGRLGEALSGRTAYFEVLRSVSGKK